MAGRKGNTGPEASRRPLYQRTAEALAAVMAEVPEGSCLPSEPALAHQLGVSRATLREAMRSFEERGLIVRRQGLGTYVTRPPRVIETGLEVLESLETLARRSGLKVEMGALAISERPPQGGEAERFELSAAESLVEIRRVISAEARPAAYLIDVLPRSVLSETDLRQGFSGSVLDLLLRRGVPPLGLSETAITAVSAPAEIARSLHVQRGDVLLSFEASLYSQAGRVIDRSLSYFLPGYFRFHVLRRVGQTRRD